MNFYYQSLLRCGSTEGSSGGGCALFCIVVRDLVLAIAGAQLYGACVSNFGCECF